MLGMDVTPPLNFLRLLHAIKVGPVEIVDSLTILTDQVMVWLQITVEPDAIVHGIQTFHDAATFKGVNRSIDGIQRNRGQFPPDPLADFFSRGMTGSRKQFPKDFETLMG